MYFHYVAFNRSGTRVEGQLEVPDETVAEEVLWEQGLTVATLSPVRPSFTLYTLFPTFLGVKRRDLIIFSRQLTTLLASGIDMIRALRLLAEQAANPALRHTLQEVITGLEQGQSLSIALAAHPTVFSRLYVASIAVGERTGQLEGVLDQLARYLEKEEALARKLANAMAYPVFVLLVAIGVVILMLTVALPPMVTLFETFGGELPLPTRILIAITRFVSAYGLYVATGIVLLTVGLVWGIGQPSGRRLWDAFLLRLPLLGPVILQAQLARFAHTAAVLIRAGLPLSEIMELVLKTTGNVVVAAALERVRMALLAGQGLSLPLAKERLFPSLLAQMVRVGEETGTLENNLQTLASFYEEEVDRSTQLMASLIEPALTIFIGLVVGFIAVSMVMPMYSILSEIQ